MFPEYAINNVNNSIKIYQNGEKYEIDLINLATTKWGFSTKENCKWRMMYYDNNNNFSTNIFNNGRLNVFSKTFSVEENKRMIEELLGVRHGENGVEFDMRIVNIVVHFDIGKECNLDYIYTDGKSDEIYDSNDMPDYTEEVKILDKQRHSGLRIIPFDSKNIGITVYSTGKIIAYGMKCEEEIQDVIDYIRTKCLIFCK